MPVAGFNPALGPPSNVNQYVGSDGLPLLPRNARGRFRPVGKTGAALMWYGEAVEARVAAAAMAGVKAIAELAADHARANHPWKNRTEETEASIFVGEPHITPADVVRCPWGAAGAAVFLEYGTAKMPAYPFLRPAQDATYPHLLGTMRASL